ncbi:MAG TPA: hypothetical protein PK189_10870, partial [bacterium]|nr:hypothetical protein [bacterium]
IYFYTLILVFSLALIMRGRPIHYMILYMPFLLLIIFRLITQDYLLSTTKQKILGLFVFLHLFYSIVYTISLINKNYKITIEEQNRLICQDIPIGKKITCPITFIYNEVKNYQIEGLIYYDIIEKKKNIKYSIDELFLEISRNGSEYIIINEPLKYNIEKLKCGDKIADFELFAIKSNSYIFKKTALIL